jgi:hypothetical protein
MEQVLTELRQDACRPHRRLCETGREDRGIPIRSDDPAGVADVRHGLDLPPTGGEWKTINLKVTLEAGANRVEFCSLIEAWESIAVERLELMQP